MKIEMAKAVYLYIQRMITVNPINNGASKVFFQNFCSKLIFKFD